MSVDNALLRPMFIEPGTKKQSLVQWDNVGIMDGFNQEGNLKAYTGEKLPVHLANVNMELTNDRNANKTNPNMVEANEVTSGGEFNTEAGPIIPKTDAENVMGLTKKEEKTFEERLAEVTPEEKAIQSQLEKYDPKAAAEGYIKEFVGKEPTLQQRFNAMKKIVNSGEQNDDTDLMALRLITDLFTLKSPAEGKWEQAFDIMAQTLGRETERAMIKRQSKSAQDKELAIKAIDQHHASKENALAQKAQFWLQAMGSDVDLMKFGAGMEHDFALEGLRQAGAESLEKLRASLEPKGALKGTAVNLAIADDSAPQGYRIGTGIIGEDGKIQKLVGQDEDTQELIYQPISDDDFMIPKESPLNETLSGKPQGKMMDLRADYHNLQSARDVLGQIVQEELRMQKQGGSYLGVQGVIDGLTQETYATFNDMLSAINPKLEAQFFNAANDLYIRDLMTEGTMNDQTAISRAEEGGMGEFIIDVPKKGLFGEGTEKNVVQASVRDLLSQSVWEDAVYDPVFEYIKVRENILIYALARALKPTGRLNVDDIRRAADSVDLTGLKSKENVLAKLQMVDQRLAKGQASIVQTLGDEKLVSDQTEVTKSVEDIINQGVGQN